ncbi:hypothetical protein AB0K18_42850 [Nonomuraea sp. NPDC049421]|uniref:hypothetical protein n=1 Tax=Nonomuraea sp. NPDC049421 TaxID=3155275 RepID=UPI00341AE9AB
MPTVRPETYQTANPPNAIPRPSTAVSGDLLLAFVAYEYPEFDAALTGGTPEWVPLASKSTVSPTADGVLTSGFWWKPAGTTADTGWRLDFDSGPTFMVMTIIAVTGTLLEAPPYTVSADQGGTGSPITTVTSPAGPSPNAEDLELRWVAGDNYLTEATRAWSSPAGTSEIADLDAGYLTGQLTAETLTGPSTSERTHTITGGGVYSAHGFTLRIPGLAPPAATAPVVLTPTAAAHRATSW